MSICGSERTKEEEEASKWSISFALSLSGLGDIQATVSLDGNDIYVKINTEKAEAIQVLQENEADMGAALSELGLNLNSLQLYHGLENNKIDAKNLRLLDIRI